MKFRVLTHEEAATVPGMQSPVPASMIAVGATDEQGVVCCIGLFLALCADPIWIREDHRARGVTLLRLWDAAREEIIKRGGGRLRVGMTDTNPGEPTESLVARMCETAGGCELHARFFEVPVAKEVEA